MRLKQKDGETELNRKFMEFMKLMNIYLNHFPNHEKYALASRVRNTAYELYDLLTEGQKRYHKKTTLTELDITHERLRMQLFLAYEMGYFRYRNNKEVEKSPAKLEEKRFTTISLLCDELGRMIGGWIKKMKHYVRYVDDLVLIGLNRLQCLRYRNIIIDMLQADFVLQLSKSTIQKVKRGVNFVGYRTWKAFRLIRKYSLYKFKQCVRKEKWESIVSLLGHAKDTASLLHMKTILKEIINAKTLSVPKNHRRVYNVYCSG